MIEESNTKIEGVLADKAAQQVASKLPVNSDYQDQGTKRGALLAYDQVQDSKSQESDIQT